MSSQLPVTDNSFWRQRIMNTLSQGRPLHAVIYDIDTDTWNRIEFETARLLRQHIQPGMSILDIGCGYGSIYGTIKAVFSSWIDRITYVGADSSEDLIQLARTCYPGVSFHRIDCSDLPFLDKSYDLVVCRSVMAMLRDNGMLELADKITSEIKRVGKDHLIFEYGDIVPGTAK